MSAEDEVAIGGHERVMGPNGEAQYFAPDLLSAYKILYDHYEFTYVMPGALLFIPLYQLLIGWRLTDSLWSLVVTYPTFTLPFATWLLTGYF